MGEPADADVDLLAERFLRHLRALNKAYRGLPYEVLRIDMSNPPEKGSLIQREFIGNCVVVNRIVADVASLREVRIFFDDAKDGIPVRDPQVIPLSFERVRFEWTGTIVGGAFDAYLCTIVP